MKLYSVLARKRFVSDSAECELRESVLCDACLNSIPQHARLRVRVEHEQTMCDRCGAGTSLGAEGATWLGSHVAN